MLLSIYLLYILCKILKKILDSLTRIDLVAGLKIQKYGYTTSRLFLQSEIKLTGF